MKHIVLLCAALVPLAAAFGGGPSPDPLGGSFFPPELIMQAREQIGLQQEQMETLRTRMEKAQPQFEDIRQRLERESAALAEVARQERVDEAKLLAQLDKVLDAERGAKHLQLSLLAAIKNLLTPEQQSRLREIAKGSGSPTAEGVRQRLTGKVQRVQAGARKWAESGRDPSAIGETMNSKVKPLLDTGKTTEAEAELDRLLEQLEHDVK